VEKTYVCRVCGSSFTHLKAGAAAYCSEECRKRRQAEFAADWYARRSRQEPEFLATRAENQRRRRGHKPCDIEGCEAPRQHRGNYCLTHGNRTRGGYVVHKAGGVRVVQHRAVMERMLGRTLRAFESVHHKNGRRDDNRPSNLELWTRPQPSGQRPEDLVNWVVENYRDLVAVAIGGS
jgi:hypothetical protein